MLEAFTISSDSRFHTLVILTEKKSTRAYTLEIGTISFNEYPQVILTLLIVEKSSWGMSAACCSGHEGYPAINQRVLTKSHAQIDRENKATNDQQ